jgi:membrane protease YdiL (CAAX protease family)
MVLWLDFMSWDFILILVLLGAVVPWRSSVHIRTFLRQTNISSRQRLSLYSSTIVFQWLVAGVTFWRCRVHGLSDMHLGITLGAVARTFFLSIVLAALLGLNQWVSLRANAKEEPLPDAHSAIQQKLRPQAPSERLAFLALVCTAAICEEFLYRGFVQAIFTRVDWVGAAEGILMAAMFFAVAHSYQGKRGVLTTFVVGIVFSLTRYFTGSLLPTVLAHFVTDAMAGLLPAAPLSDGLPAPAGGPGTP